MTRILKDEIRCTATSKTTGERCGNARIPGAKTCRFHGSGTKRSKAKAARVVAAREAEKAVATLGLAVDISPTDALLEEVKWTAGHVAWLRERVEELDEEALTWGTAQHSSGPEGTTITEKAGPSIWYELYAQERRHLVVVCAAALRAGVEERRVQVAEAQGAQLAAVIRAILDDLRLTAAQQKLVASVVPRHLRAIGGGS